MTLGAAAAGSPAQPVEQFSVQAYDKAKDLHIVSKPLQRPHPRIFQVGTSAKWFQRAADKGYGVVLGGPAPTEVFTEPAKLQLWAKIATTIDQLSEGRLVLGLGVGWMREEFQALGREHLFDARGRVADEQIAVLGNLLTEEHHSFSGEFYAYEDIAFRPKSYDDSRPLQIWIGGEAKPARRRAGRLGDSWFPYFPRITPGDLRAKYDNVRRAAEEAGRDPDDVRLNCCLSVEITDHEVEQEPDLLRGTAEQVGDALERFRDVGVEHVGLQFLVGRYPERVEQMRRLSQAVIGPGLLA